MNTAAPGARRFDGNRAWQEAAAVVNGNREVLAALAGVFVVLPAFALGLLLPEFQPIEGAQGEEALRQVTAFLDANWMPILGVALVQTVGSLAMLALCGHRSRPTVGQAITRGLAATPIAILAQILQGAIFAVAFLIPASIGGLTGSVAFTAVTVLIGLGLIVYLIARFAMTNPVIAIEGLNNPVTALVRAFALTRGNAAQVLLFYFLLIAAFVIGSMVLEVGFGLAAHLIGGAEAQKLVAGFVSSVLQGAMAAYVAATLASGYRQLAGEPSAA